MVLYEVFSQSVTFKYKSTVCSKSTIFLAVTTFLTILLPLLVAYRSRGFWMKSSSYREQPQVYFKHEYLLHMETDKPDMPIVCSSLPISQDFSNCPSIKSREDDNNQDGINDELTIEIKVSLPLTSTVYSVQLILIFDYMLQKQCLLQMETLALIQHNSGLPGCRLDVTADLRLIQKQLLNCRSRDLRYNHSIFSSEDSSEFQLNNILKRYGKRNVSTNVDNIYSTWTRGELLDEPFVITANIIYTEHIIMYKPGFWQVMKWAWIQYFSILVLFLCFFRSVKCYVFMNQLVPAVQEIPWKKTF